MKSISTSRTKPIADLNMQTDSELVSTLKHNRFPKTLASAGSLMWVAGVCASANLHAQTVSESREWTDSYPVSGVSNTLEISNIWGNVEVRQGEAGKIVVSVKETRSAPDQQLFDRSLEVLKLTTESDENGISLIVGQRWGNWRHHQSCRDCRVEYQFDVQVPAQTDIDVSTVNDGKVKVTDVEGRISASNVNGPIFVSNAQLCNSFTNVNGVVDLSFTQSPQNDCEIETVNGDVKLALPASAGINLALNQSNGKVISEFDVDSFSLPAKVEHIESDGINRYRIHQAAGLRLAGGGKIFTISSLNGDIRIQKTK